MGKESTWPTNLLLFSVKYGKSISSPKAEWGWGWGGLWKKVGMGARRLGVWGSGEVRSGHGEVAVGGDCRVGREVWCWSGADGRPNLTRSRDEPYFRETSLFREPASPDWCKLNQRASRHMIWMLSVHSVIDRSLSHCCFETGLLILDLFCCSNKILRLSLKCVSHSSYLWGYLSLIQ